MEDPLSQTVLIVEDDSVNLEGMQAYLSRQGFTVFTAATYDDGLASFKAHLPAVVIMDIMLVQHAAGELQTYSGLELAQRLRAIKPQTSFIFRSAYSHYEGKVLEFVEAGRSGVAYLYKGGGRPSELIRVLKIVADGGVYLDPCIMVAGYSVADAVLRTLTTKEKVIVERLLSRFESLTPRELEVVETLSWSRTTAAEHLGISSRTVDRHVANLYRKLELTQEDYPDVRQDVMIAKAYLIYRLQKGDELAD